MMSKKIILGVFIALFAALSLLPMEADAQGKKQRRRARNLVAQGDVLYRKKDYQAAIFKYAEALSIVPKLPLAHYSKGMAHFNLKKYDEAASEFGIALDQGYGAIRIYSVRWRAYFANKQFGRAMSDVQAAKRIAPDNAYFFIAEGQILHAQKQYQEAVDAYDEAVSRGSNNKNIGYLMALSYSGLGNWVRQAEFAEQALRSATGFPDQAWFLLGDAQQRMRKYEEAMRSYQNAMSVNPRIYGVYINLAETYRVLNRLDDAIETALAGTEKFPADATLRINLSWYYSLSDRNPEAILYANQAIRLAPKQYLGYTNLCRAYNDDRKLQLALENCRKALELQPGDGETHFYMGRTYQLMNDADTAFEHYDKAVAGLIKFTAGNPNYADGYYLLGNAYSVTDKRREAIRAYRTSLQIAPLFARARFNLGIVYIRNGDLAAARRQQAALEDIDAQLAKKLLEAING